MNKRISICLIAALIFCLLAFPLQAFADSPSDEIINYSITADVNEDATVSFAYHIEWKVLESYVLGPVNWVTVGVPNSHIYELQAESGNIDYLFYSEAKGSAVDIYFDKDYHEGEIISFDFSFSCDNMYEMNAFQEGESVYYFTPGWFDEIAVDELCIRWNSDKLSGISGEALLIDGYYTWTTSLKAGEKFSIKLFYPNDAFLFDEEKVYAEGLDHGYDYGNDYYDDYGVEYGAGSAVTGLIIILFMIFKTIAAISGKAFGSGAGFSSGATETKLTRTKVVYFDSCPSCGAPREEGKTACSYCGKNLIKSEEIIKEENIKAEDKEALRYKKKGEYHYSSDPNTFVRVNVVHVPVVGRSGGLFGGPRGGGRSGGCAHSSCACASCACACACACAGGGRAGCSVKDFYNARLKMKQLERKSSR